MSGCSLEIYPGLHVLLLDFWCLDDWSSDNWPSIVLRIYSSWLWFKVSKECHL